MITWSGREFCFFESFAEKGNRGLHLDTKTLRERENMTQVCDWMRQDDNERHFNPSDAVHVMHEK